MRIYDIASGRSEFQKDFKRRGLIGEAGEKDKLSYINLLKQIQEGQEKGFNDKKIVTSVLRAINHGFYLRYVLETMKIFDIRPLNEIFTVPLCKEKHIRPAPSTDITNTAPSGISITICLQSQEFAAKTCFRI